MLIESHGRVEKQREEQVKRITLEFRCSKNVMYKISI